MVAYNFQKQFVPAIESGDKTHTIRKNGKRPHAKTGSKLQLYYGMRTKVCRKIRDAVCVFAVPITIDVLESTITEIRVGSELVDDLEAFAKSDGFESLEAMHQFWIEFNGVGLFECTFIEWEVITSESPVSQFVATKQVRSMAPGSPVICEIGATVQVFGWHCKEGPTVIKVDRALQKDCIPFSWVKEMGAPSNLSKLMKIL